MIIPAPLQPKDRVALIAPSSPQQPQTLDAALESVRDLGLEPVLYGSCREEHGYLAGKDELRAGDINKAFADDSIRGILCIRGGYGAHRLIPMLDYSTIGSHPKRLCGYSDITALHIQLNQRCNMVSWHTPMPGTEWHKGLDAFTLQSLKQALFGDVAMDVKNPADAPLQALAPGKAKGQLVGGNLSLITATLGTPYEIDTRGKIIFIEDIDEEPHNLDRMLVQLSHAGKLQSAAGILIGAFTNCVPQNDKPCLAIDTILNELVIPVGKPTIAGLQCGHLMPTLSLPLGCVAHIDTSSLCITLTEA